MAKQLEKATITILEGRRKGTIIKVMFNPAEYTHEISNNFQETPLPGLANPIVQFVNGESQSLTMELLFDTWTNGRRANVTTHTQAIVAMLAIDKDLHAPPPVEFSWGGFHFPAVVASLSQRFTMFDGDGTPVRATLNVTFKQYRPLSKQLDDPKRKSSDRTKRRVLDAGDSLWAMAAREYGEPAEWRRIAIANRIEAPRSVRPGTSLILPPLEGSDGAAER